jgi:hypothetical protein
MKKGTKEFDPDRLVPSKKEILEFCDKVLAKWKAEPETNSRNIVAMTAVKTSVFWTDEESLKAIWGEILKWTFELMYKNAIAQAKEENSEWSPVLEKLKKKKDQTHLNQISGIRIKKKI